LHLREDFFRNQASSKLQNLDLSNSYLRKTLTGRQEKLQKIRDMLLLHFPSHGHFLRKLIQSTPSFTRPSPFFFRDDTQLRLFDKASFACIALHYKLQFTIHDKCSSPRLLSLSQVSSSSLCTQRAFYILDKSWILNIRCFQAKIRTICLYFVCLRSESESERIAYLLKFT
jgi:hypothetical protein